MKISLRSVSFCSVIAVASLLAGCASDPATAAKAKADKDEYVTVMTTGSNIPVRIKKSDLEKGKVAKGTVADQVDKDEFNRNLRPGRAIDGGK